MKARKSKQNSVRQTIGYVRASTEDQMITIDAQEAKIRTYAVAMDWFLAEVVRDPGCSAKSLERPGIGNILEAVRCGEVERIIVSRLDRLTRSTRDLADLLDLFSKNDVALVSIGETLDTSSAAGRMVVNMLGVVGQWEREAIAERTATALAYKRKNRVAYGKTPFGYRRAGDALVPNADEQGVLAEAVRMDKAGASFREIGRMLADRCGRTWGPSSVRAMLRSRIVVEAAAPI